MDDYQDPSPQKINENLDEGISLRPTLRTTQTSNIVKPNNLSALNESTRSLSPSPRRDIDLSNNFKLTSSPGYSSAREIPTQPAPKIETQNRISNDFKPIVQDEPNQEIEISRQDFLPRFGIDVQEVLSQRQSLVFDNDTSFSSISNTDRTSPISGSRVSRTFDFSRPTDLRSATPEPTRNYSRREKDDNPLFWSTTSAVQQRMYTSYMEPRRNTITEERKRDLIDANQFIDDRRKTIDVGYLRNAQKRDNPMYWSTAQNVKKVYEPKIAEKNVFDEFLLPRGVGKILEEETENIRLMELHVTQQKYKIEIDMGQIIEDISETLNIYKSALNNKLDKYLDDYKMNYKTLRDKVTAYKQRAKEYFHSNESKTKALNIKDTFNPIMKGIQFYRTVEDISEPLKKFKEEVCEVHGNAFTINREVSKRMIGIMTEELTKQTSHKPLYAHTESVQTMYFEIKEEIIEKVKESMKSFETIMYYSVPPEIFSRFFAFPKIESIISEDNLNIIGDSQRIVSMKIFLDKQVDFEPENLATCIRALPGEHVAVGCKDGTVKLYNYQSGMITSSFKCHNNAISTIDYMKLQIPEINDIVLITGSSAPDCSIRVWNIATQKCLKLLKGHKDTVTSLLPMKDGLTLLSSSFENNILIWNLNTGKLFNKVTNHTKKINVLHQLKDNARIVSASDDHTFTVWKLIYDYSNELKKRVVTSCEVEKVFEDVCEITSINSSTDEHNIVITGGADGRVKVWNIDKGECIKQVFAHGLGVSSLLYFENPFKVDIYEKYLVIGTGFADNTMTGVKSGTTTVGETLIRNDNLYFEIGSVQGNKTQIVKTKGQDAPLIITVCQKIGKGINIWSAQ